MNPRFHLTPPDECAPATDRAVETKQAMILRELAQRSLNRFEAERLGDHCLHSTVALLRAKGHAIYSQWETVQTRFKPVQVKRYFLIRRHAALMVFYGAGADGDKPKANMGMIGVETQDKPRASPEKVGTSTVQAQRTGGA